MIFPIEGNYNQNFQFLSLLLPSPPLMKQEVAFTAGVYEKCQLFFPKQLIASWGMVKLKCFKH